MRAIPQRGAKGRSHNLRKEAKAKPGPNQGRNPPKRRNSSTKREAGQSQEENPRPAAKQAWEQAHTMGRRQKPEDRSNPEPETGKQQEGRQ